MAGTRAFDDDRWPDQEGYAVCFLCGRPVDPRDPQRGTYTANARACDPVPIHLTCVNAYYPNHMRTLHDLFMAAITIMGKVAARRAREEAAVVVPAVH